MCLEETSKKKKCCVEEFTIPGVGGSYPRCGRVLPNLLRAGVKEKYGETEDSLASHLKAWPGASVSCPRFSGSQAFVPPALLDPTLQVVRLLSFCNSVSQDCITNLLTCVYICFSSLWVCTFIYMYIYMCVYPSHSMSLWNPSTGVQAPSSKSSNTLPAFCIHPADTERKQVGAIWRDLSQAPVEGGINHFLLFPLAVVSLDAIELRSWSISVSKKKREKGMDTVANWRSKQQCTDSVLGWPAWLLQAYLTCWQSGRDGNAVDHCCENCEVLSVKPLMWDLA